MNNVSKLFLKTIAGTVVIYSAYSFGKFIGAVKMGLTMYTERDNI